MSEQKIVIDLPNGDKLVAEDCTFTNGGQIAIGVVHNDIWIQDLAVVETKTTDEGEYIENKFNVYVYGDEFDENYTDKTEIDRTPDSALN